MALKENRLILGQRCGNYSLKEWFSRLIIYLDRLTNYLKYDSFKLTVKSICDSNTSYLRVHLHV